MRRRLWVLALPTFFLNPFFACDSSEPDFQYGATELRAAVEGTWSVTLTPVQGAPLQGTLQLDQAAKPSAASLRRREGAIRSAHACETRTLFKTAEACDDGTTMPLKVSFVSGDTALNGGTLSGEFSVPGTIFEFGNLFLQIGSYRLSAKITAMSAISDVRVLDGAARAATLVRL
jgi:hypothetical protein